MAWSSLYCGWAKNAGSVNEAVARSVEAAGLFFATGTIVVSTAVEVGMFASGNQTADKTKQNIGIGLLAWQIGARFGGVYGIGAEFFLKSTFQLPELKSDYSVNPGYNYPDAVKVDLNLRR